MSDVIPPRRRRFAPLVIVSGVAATLLLAFATTGALSGFTASINNSVNTTASGTLLMTETQGATTCLSTSGATISTNAGTCATINKFGGSTTMVPGVPVTASVTIKNNGTVPANTFTLTPGGCSTTAVGSPSAGTDTAGFCGKIDVTIADTTSTTCVYPVAAAACGAPSSSATLSTLGTTALTLATPLAAGASRSYTFTLVLDNTNATNADQGLQAAETLLWSFGS